MVDGSLHEGKDQSGAHQPGAVGNHEAQELPARAVPPGPGAAQYPDGSGQQDQRGGDQPGDLRGKIAGEQAPCTGGPSIGVSDAADQIAVEASQSVVAEGKFQDRIGLRPADVGAGRCRPEFNQDQPPSGRHGHGDPRGQQMQDPLPPPDPGRQQVGGSKPRNNQEHLHLLGQETQPEQCPGQEHPGQRPAADRLQGPQQAVGGCRHQQDQQGLGVVVAEHQQRHGSQGQHQSGQQAGAGAPPRGRPSRRAGKPRPRP